jgi:hypothetical protein
MVARTGHGWVSLAKPQRRAALAVIGRAWDQAAMAASTFTDAVPGTQPDTFTVFVEGYSGEVPYEAVQAFSRAVGYPVNVARYPNGFTIDVNVGGFSQKPTFEQVRAAALNALSGVPEAQNSNLRYVQRSYDSEYLVDGEYKEAINAVKVRRQTVNARGGAGSGDTGVSYGDLGSIEKAFREKARGREQAFRKWTKAVEGKLQQERNQERDKEIGVLKRDIDAFGRSTRRSISGLVNMKAKRPPEASRELRELVKAVAKRR